MEYENNISKTKISILSSITVPFYKQLSYENQSLLFEKLIDLYKSYDNNVIR